MLVDLQHYGVIKVSGIEAAKFLQGQLSCDVLALQSGESTLGCHCNIKGKISSLFRLWRLGEDYYLRLLKELITPTLLELKKYSVFSKVNLQDVSDVVHGFGITGDKFKATTLNDEIIIMPSISGQRYEIFGPIQTVQNLLQECQDATHVAVEAWEKLDIQDQIPEIYFTTIDTFFPHDLNLPNLGAVSFKKGCYRGQEIVARMQHRGNLKRHLKKFTVRDASSICQPGSVITTAGDPNIIAGTVVRAVQNNNEINGLAVINETHAEAKLFLDGLSINI